MEVDAFAGSVRAPDQRGRALGVAPHSLRAVTPDELALHIAIARDIGPDAPLHIHAAEQVREVEECITWSGARPVEWLLDHAAVDRSVVSDPCDPHAAGRDGSARASGAAAGLCQTTEANLGDGIFPLRAYVQAGGSVRHRH